MQSVTGVLLVLLSLLLCNLSDAKMDVVVYLECQCPDTTRFVHQELGPFYRRFPAGLDSLTIVPFGLADCTRQPSGRINCTCQHLAVECQLNQLMNCIINRFKRTVDQVAFLDCIQGRSSLDDALSNCLVRLSPTEQSALTKCANGPMGEQLHYEAGKRTKQAGVRWSPWIEINGKVFKETRHLFLQEVCQRTGNCLYAPASDWKTKRHNRATLL